MTERLTWDYLAGYVDGDGSIGFSSSGRTSTPYLTIHSSVEGILHDIARFVGAGFVRPHRRRRRSESWSAGFYFRLGGIEPLGTALRNLVPRLIAKKAQAECVLAFLERRAEKRNRRWEPEDYAFVERMKLLNKRGS